MNCLLLSNTNIYDLININYIIDYLSKKYIIIYIFIENVNIHFCKLFFNNIKNIQYLIKDNIINIDLYINDFINLKKEKNDVIKLGIFNDNWKLLKDNNEIENMPINYFEIFYKQINLDYIHSKIINRNYQNEDIFYNNFINICNKNYIFTYNLDKQDILYLKDNKYDIYDPLKNINDSTTWVLLNTNNIMDYLIVIEKAQELHINDLNMLLLLSLIDLSHIKNKYAYTKKFFLKKYFKNLQDWNFIYK